MDVADIKAASAVSQSDGHAKPGAVHVSGKQTHPSNSNECAENLDTIDAAGNGNDANSPLARKVQNEASNDASDGLKIRGDDGAVSKSTVPMKNEDSKALTGPSSQRYHQANSRLNDDLEFGEFDLNITGSDVAVALPVDETEAYSPTAVEYESDAKPSSSTTSRRFGVYVFLGLAAVIIGITGAVAGIILTNTSPKESNPLPKSRADVCRERVAQFVSPEQLEKTSNPYRKALDWISNSDPMSTTPDNPRFVQRYVLAYIYFATSIKQPWVSDCAPSDDIDKFNCVYNLKLDEERAVSQTAFKWLSNTDECEWAGLHCDLKSQIDRIELGGIGMSGTFPDGVFHLRYLNDISLMYGELEGPLPELMGGIKNLCAINLRSNKFTGTIPSEWLHSRSLQNIILESNRITGQISSSISQLYDLQDVNLNGNSLTGTIPSEIGDLSSLHYFGLERNSVHGSIPKTLGRLKYSYAFRASSNLITGTIPMEIGDMDNIQDFTVSGNLLTGEIPESFWKATNLYIIRMADNFLTGTISGKITTLANLGELTISNNQFTGALPARLGQTNVWTIKASGNMFNGTIAPQICDLVEIGQVEILELDCAAPINAGTNTNNTAEIICPTDCCTLCCTPDGKNCRPN